MLIAVLSSFMKVGGNVGDTPFTFLFRERVETGC